MNKTGKMFSPAQKEIETLKAKNPYLHSVDTKKKNFYEKLQW
jgi:hypothetical protein